MGTGADVSLYTAAQPDITFFGEKLDDVFDRSLLEDRGQVDLLVIIGTSLKVSPVSDTICEYHPHLLPPTTDITHARPGPAHLPHSVPQVLINKTPVRHINPDVSIRSPVLTVLAWPFVGSVLRQKG